VTYDLSSFTLPPTCSCTDCVQRCKEHPGWPTPEEAEKMLDADLASAMMLDWWDADESLPYTEVLSPASVGYGGIRAPELTGDLWTFLRSPPPIRGACVFLREGLCEVHNPTSSRSSAATTTTRSTNPPSTSLRQRAGTPRRAKRSWNDGSGKWDTHHEAW
jgi:hypothetical protein